MPQQDLTLDGEYLETEEMMRHVFPVLRIRILDPGSGAFLNPGSGIREVKSQDPDPGSGMNNKERIS